MFYPFFIFIFDILLWYILPIVQVRFGIDALTDVAFLAAFGFFMLGIAEFAELVFSIDGDVVDETKERSL